MLVPDPDSERLTDLSQCAYRLGLAFGAEAERAEDWARKIEFFELFDRCGFSVRMAVALKLRLRRPVAASEPRTDRETLADPAEHEALDRDPRERDREGDRERASLPLLLKTLNGVVEAAAALPGPEPADLPTLRELLAQITGAPAPAARPPGALRARLAGSATATLPIPKTPVRPGSALTASLRRATGPPRL